MKIAMVASEAAPFIKTGGLGDVMQALPAALGGIPGAEVTLFLPFYPRIKYSAEVEREFVECFTVDLAWRQAYVGLFRLKSRKRKLKVYFIDNEQYFGHADAYGYSDDGERFAYFSKAVLESMLHLGYTPDVIHCHDWQTAAVPVFLRAFYQDTLGTAKTVFTIHNIEYQGRADSSFRADVMGLSEEYESTLAFDGGVDLMKAAILKSDAVTTVSETYAREILSPGVGHGLDGILREHAFKLRGITNGIDPSVDPAVDPGLATPYGVADHAAGKAAAKAALARELGLSADPGVPLIAMVTRLVSHKGMDLLCGVAEELMNWDLRLVILGTGDARYENHLASVAARHPGRLSVNLRFDPSLASRIYAASDLFLMPSKSEPCGLSQLIAMRFGSVPIVHEVGGLKDTVEPFRQDLRTGVGFTFQQYSAEDLLDALRRALTVYAGDKDGFDAAVQNCMTYDSSWDRPAEKYLALYRELVG